MIKSHDFKNNLEAMDTPWIDSPFFTELIKNIEAPVEKLNLAEEFHEKGYVIIDLGLEESFIDELKTDMLNLIAKEEYKQNSSFFSYNSSPRIVDASKQIKKVYELAINKKIISLLNFFYRKTPIPFSTINFIRGTEQPLHSDTIHFGSIPKGYLSASWVALENTGPHNGALKIIEGSHKLKDIDYADLKLKPAKNMKMLEHNYRIYEKYVSDLVSVLNLKEKIISMEKGSALIWSANLLHGGIKIVDNNTTINILSGVGIGTTLGLFIGFGYHFYKQ